MPADGTGTHGPRRIVLIVAGMAALGLTAWGWPTVRAFRAARAAMAQDRAALVDLAGKTVAVKQTRGQVELISLQVKNYDRLVPEDQDLGGFLEAVSEQLTAAGIHDASTRALPATTAGKCQTLPIEIHGSGTSTQCYDFLQRLEGLRRMCSVGRLSLQSDAAMTGQVSMDLTVSIYSAAPKAN